MIPEDDAPIPRGVRLVGRRRDEVAEWMARKYRVGKSVQAIADLTGRSYGAAYKMLREQKVEFRSRGGANNPNPPSRTK